MTNPTLTTEPDVSSPTTTLEVQVSSKPVGYRYYDTEDRPHVHTWNDENLMGGSSVVGVLEKPLAWWASGMAVSQFGWMFSKKKVGGKWWTNSENKRLTVAGLYLMKLRSITVQDFLAWLDSAYRAHNEVKEDKAVSGTLRHKFLEEYIVPCIRDHGGVPQEYTGSNRDVRIFAQWAQANVKRFIWSEVNCCSVKLWTGGIADVGWIDMQDRLIAGDFKSSKEAYMSHFCQISGYDIMLNESGGMDNGGNLLFAPPGYADGYCVIPFGQLTDPFGNGKLEPEFVYNTQDFRDAFPAIVQLYKLKKKYDAKA